MRTFESIDSLDDPRIAPYRNLKDRDLSLKTSGEKFIVESEMVVRRFLESDFPADSVLLAARRVEEILPIIPESVPVYVAPDAMMQQILGFKFHSGVIACGRRKPALSLDAFLNSAPTRATLMVCPEIANTENLGGLMRIAAAFGVDGFLLGPNCCDPFYRQAIRVSMGTVFKLNLLQSADLETDLQQLRQEGHFELLATVLDLGAHSLSTAKRPDRIALLFGNEAQGLSPRLVELCDRKITIPMQLGTDSLNVAISAAICLYHFQSQKQS